MKINNSRKSDPDIIMLDICVKHKITLNELLSQRRQANLVEARIDCAKKLRNLGLSLPQIGRLMNRDHTTILHHLRKEIESG